MIERRIGERRGTCRTCRHPRDQHTDGWGPCTSCSCAGYATETPKAVVRKKAALKPRKKAR